MKILKLFLRPEDMDVVEPEAGKVSGTIISKVFMGVHYEYLVETKTEIIRFIQQKIMKLGKK